MGIKYEWRTRDEVASIVDGLAKAASNFTAVLMQMSENDMEQALMTWSARHWDCYDIISAAAATCASMMPLQVDAKKQNRPSKYEKALVRSAADMASRTKKAVAAGVKKKPAGRPRKKG